VVGVFTRPESNTLRKSQRKSIYIWVIPALLLCLLTILVAEALQKEQPFAKHLPPDSVHYMPLVEAETFESGCVALQPGDFGDEHSSKSWQEMLVVLGGQGEVIIGGEEKLPIQAGDAVYIPRQTIHQLHCTGETALQYVYVAAKTSP